MRPVNGCDASMLFRRNTHIQASLSASLRVCLVGKECRCVHGPLAWAWHVSCSPSRLCQLLSTPALRLLVEVAGVFVWWSWAKHTHVEMRDGDEHRFNIPHRVHVRCLVTILHQQVPTPAINTLPGPPVAFFTNLGAYFWDNKSLIWVINLLWWLCRVETREEEEEDRAELCFGSGLV